MNAIAGPRPASGLSVAILRPGWTASRGAPSRPPSAEPVASRSSTRNAMPHRRAGPSGFAGHARALGRLHHLEDRLAQRGRTPAGWSRPASRPRGCGAARSRPSAAPPRCGRGRATAAPRDRCARRRSAAARAGRRAARLGRQLPAEDAAPRPLPHEPQAHARHPAHAVLDLEAERAPVRGLVGDLELLERRHRAGRYRPSALRGRPELARNGRPRRQDRCGLRHDQRLALGRRWLRLGSRRRRRLLDGGLRSRSPGAARPSTSARSRPPALAGVSSSSRLTGPSLRPSPACSGAPLALAPAFSSPRERAARRSAPRRPWLRSALLRSPRSSP